MIKIEKCVNNNKRLQAESIKLLDLQFSFQRFKRWSKTNQKPIQN